VLNKITGSGARRMIRRKRLHTVHARHFEIERDDVGTELFDLFQGEFAIHRGATTSISGSRARIDGISFPHER